jgi:polyhydroxybutyrate depolymerase
MRHAGLAMAAAMMAISACASAEPVAAAPAGLAEYQMQSRGAERSYLTYTPRSLTEPAPLVIMLHGGGGNAENGMTMSGFNALAEREGFVAVYPEGSGKRRFKTWNAGHCCVYAREQDVDDVGFISDLIDRLVADGVADPSRVYATGMSNGAMMTYRIGRELPHKVAAIAPVVGAMFGDEVKAKSPVAALMITGEQDMRVPAAGGNGSGRGLRSAPNDRPYAPAGFALSCWLKSNACTGQAQAVSTPAYTLRQGTGCAAPTLWYSLPEGGHAWPGGRRGSLRGDAPVDNFDASTVIWEFFSAQELPR